MKEKEISSFYPENPEQWRSWLQENHQKEQSVWLIMYKIKSGMPSVSWSQAVDEALCFGWIDSKAVTLDDQKYMQFFCKRKAKGTWSKVNKDKIEKLVAEGKMTASGMEVINRAKENGSWTILDEVEALIIPQDLEKEFETRPGTKDLFLSLGKSVKKLMLYRVSVAKQPETRQKRILEILATLAAGKKPK